MSGRTDRPVGATDLGGACDYLNMSPQYVKALVAAGALPVVRMPGGRYRIGYAALDRLLLEGFDMAAIEQAVTDAA